MSDAWTDHQSQIAALEHLAFNFDATKTKELNRADGWHIDTHSIMLGEEPPGAPTPHGFFAKAKEIIRYYKFPDPSLIEGIYQPEAPLLGRNMLLKAKFLGMTFYLGTRISQVIETEKPLTSGGQESVWGYVYSTLKGHFEMGSMQFSVHKDERTGEVSFHIEAYSKPDRIANPFYRLGFKIFGRSLQKRFAKSSLDRMRQLVHEELAK